MLDSLDSEVLVFAIFGDSIVFVRIMKTKVILELVHEMELSQ